MFGLFAPHRYKIEEYDDIPVEELGDNYRELSILLNRSGSSGALKVDMYFNGASNYFSRIPFHSTNEDMKKTIQIIKSINGRTI